MHPNAQSTLSSSDNPNFIYVTNNIKWSNRTRCVPGRPDWKSVLGAVCQRRKVFFVCKTMPLVCTIETQNYYFMQKMFTMLRDRCRHQNGWILKKKMQFDFPKRRGWGGGVKGCLQLSRKFIPFVTASFPKQMSWIDRSWLSSPQTG